MSGSKTATSAAATTARVVATALALLAGVVSAQRVDVRVQPDTLYLGQAATLYVTISGAESPSRPELPASILKEFLVTEQGESTQESIQIVGGRMTRSATVTYPWQLVPRRAGIFQLEALVVQGDTGEEVRSPAPSLRVLEPQPHDEILVEASIDPPRPIRDMPVTLTVEIGVRSQGGGDPLRSGRASLEITLPWLQLPDRFEGEELAQWLQNVLSPSGAFMIEGTTVSSGGFFGSTRKARFDLPARREMREPPARPGESAEYVFYRLDRVVHPHTTGTFELGRIVVSGELGGRRRYVVSEPVVLVVEEAPREGRPGSWTGAIGDLEVSAEADVSKLRVGDPLILSISLGGKVDLDSLFLPDLSLQSELSDRFRIHQEDVGEVAGNRKVFQITLRPVRAGIEAVPSIELATFDARERRYVAHSTDAIPVLVEASELLSSTEVITSEGATPRRARSLERTSEGILANHVGLHVLEDQGHRPAVTLGAVGLLAALWATIATLVGVHRRRHADPAVARRRNAERRAREALSAASDPAARGAALMGYVADVTDRSAAGLTSRDVASLAAGRGANDAEVLRAVEYLEAVEALRYGGGDEQAMLARDPLEALDRLKHMFAALLLCVTIFGLASSAGASEANRRSEMLLEAEEAFRTASSPEEQGTVAARYQRLIDDGLINGHLYFDLGNAHARTGEVGRAIAAYELAERYLPRDPDVAENLRVMRQRAVDRFVRPRSLVAEVLFWQDWLGEHEHARLLMGLSLLAFVVGLARVAAPRRVPRLVFTAIILITALELACYVHLLRHNRSTEHGIVTADEVVLSRGPGGSYEAAYSKPVHEGAPFIVLERRGAWLEIEMPGGERAWVAEQDVVTY